MFWSRYRRKCRQSANTWWIVWRKEQNPRARSEPKCWMNRSIKGGRISSWGAGSESRRPHPGLTRRAPDSQGADVEVAATGQHGGPGERPPWPGRPLADTKSRWTWDCWDARRGNWWQAPPLRTRVPPSPRWCAMCQRAGDEHKDERMEQKRKNNIIYGVCKKIKLLDMLNQQVVEYTATVECHASKTASQYCFGRKNNQFRKLKEEENPVS